MPTGTALEPDLFASEASAAGDIDDAIRAFTEGRISAETLGQLEAALAPDRQALAEAAPLPAAVGPPQPCVVAAPKSRTKLVVGFGAVTVVLVVAVVAVALTSSNGTSNAPPGWEPCGETGAYCPPEVEVDGGDNRPLVVNVEPESYVVDTWCELQMGFVGNEVNAYTLKQQWSDGRITSGGWC